MTPSVRSETSADTQCGSELDAEFDAVAAEYDEQLQRGLSVSGESGEYFARQRMHWLGLRLSADNPPRSILDFGCGTGTAAPLLCQVFAPRRVVGVDISAASLRLAGQRHAGLSDMVNLSFFTLEQLPAEPSFDLAYTSGVFHHIPPEQRADSLRYVYERLKPGGLFSFWENNPWNPGTRYIMSRIPFDRDAICLSYLESRRRLRSAGFIIERLDFCFWFPALLKWLRPIEPWLRGVPLGAQYHLLARKPQA